MTYGGDDATTQRKTISLGDCRGLIRKSRAVHCPKKPITASVPGEHSAGAIGTVCTGRKSNDQYGRARRAEVGNRPAPVVVIQVRLAFLFRNLTTVPNQSVAALAIDDSFIELAPVSGNQSSALQWLLPGRIARRFIMVSDWRNRR